MKRPNEKYQKQKEQSETVSVKSLSLADIGFDAKNANKGSVRGRGQIEASLREFGFADAGTLDRNNVIIGGNKRTEVAGEIGMDEAIIIDVDGTKPVFIRRPDLDLNNPDDDRARRLAYALNRSQEASLTWDAEVLFADMQNGLDLSAFWNQDELDALLEGMDDGADNAGTDTEPQVDKADELRQKWGVELSQLWQLGEHRIICGDCTDPTVVARVMGGEKAQMMFTDPPYGIKRDKGFDGFDGFGGFGPPIARRQYTDDWDGDRPSREVFDLLLSSASESIIFGGNFFADLLPQSKHWLVWDKLNTMPTFGDCELAWTNIDRTSVKKYTVQYNGLIGKEKDRFHPTQKPVAIFAAILTDYTNEGDIVFEPYSGSGTAIIACQNLNRKCRAIELSPGYVAVAIQRFFDHTGIAPVLIS